MILLFALVPMASAATGFVQVRGREFVLPSGEPMRLKGINLGNWLNPEGYMLQLDEDLGAWQIDQVFRELVGDFRTDAFWTAWRKAYITREDIRFIAAAGFNSIRVPFSWRLLADARPPYALDGPGWAILEQLVDWCHESGIRVIFDLHSAPGGQTGMNIDDSYGRPFLFDDPEAEALTIRIWTEIARRFAREPAVLGYNLLNEPMADFFDEKAYFPRLEPFFRRVIAAVRTVDQDHIIILGGARWDKDIETLHPPHGPNVAYTFHFYSGFINERTAVLDDIRRYVDFRARYDVPVWLGESGETGMPWIRDFRRLVEAQDIGWCFWPYKKLGADTCIASVTPPEGWATITAFSKEPRTHYADLRRTAPPQEAARRMLDALLQNIRLQRCHVNRPYLEALGLNAAAQPD